MKKIQILLDEIESEYKFTRGMTGKSSLDPKVKTALLTIPRDKFVPESYIDSAFYNAPLPIGHGQTISQPYIVAIMTDLLELESDDVVLDMAKSHFEKLGYNNIECKVDNGYDGWPEHAPYDAIIVTAAATEIPEPLIEQLKPGGRMVIPVGGPFMHQELVLVEKDEHEQLKFSDILGVAFVPFQGERGNSTTMD